MQKPCFTNTQFSRFCGFSRDVRAPGKCRSDPFAKNSSTDELTVYLVYDRISIKTTLLFLFEYFKHITATFTSTNKLFHTIRYLPNCAVVLTFLLVKPVSNRVGSSCNQHTLDSTREKIIAFHTVARDPCMRTKLC